MSRKKLFRFSKAVTIFCIVMLVLLTAKNVYLELRGTPPDYLLVAAEYAVFSAELAFNMTIKVCENRKNGGHEND